MRCPGEKSAPSRPRPRRRRARPRPLAGRRHRRRGRPARQPDRAAAARPGASSATCPSPWSTRSPASAACRPRASTASSRSTRSSPRCPAAGTRSSSATAPPATWPARTRITEALEQELGVADGETTADMEFTLDSVACMGACSQAPVMRVDEETYGNLSADQTRRSSALVKELGLEHGRGRRRRRRAVTAMPERRARRRAGEGVKVGVTAARDGRRRVSVCAGTACVFAGSMKVHDAFVAEVEAAGLQDEVEVTIIGCHGLCSQGPLAVVSDGDTYYPRLKVKDVTTRRRGAPRRRRGRREAAVRRPGHRRAHRLRPRHPLLQGSRRGSRCATWASSTRRASTSTWRAAATRPRARRSRRCSPRRSSRRSSPRACAAAAAPASRRA